MGQIHRRLPRGIPVHGVTSLADEVYVLRRKDRDQVEVEVYDVVNYRLQRSLTVPNARRPHGVTSCKHYRCVYIANPVVMCVHRLDEQGAAVQWPVNDSPRGLSVNAAHNVLVTCREVPKIKEFSSHGDLLRELTLPTDVINPRHVVQLTTGQFIVCHGRQIDSVHRVCMLSSNGRQVVHAHGGQKGSEIGRYNGPLHLALGSNKFVYVVDCHNRRVTMLSPTLDYIRQVVSRDELKWCPVRLYLDKQRRRLYVADNEVRDGMLTAGRVVVFSV